MYQNSRYHESTKGYLKYVSILDVLLSHLSITCIVDSIPHLVTVDATRPVGIVVLKDSLKESTSEFEETRLIPLGVKRGIL